ncbi:uncharacterized protein ZSWIM9 [Ornithorhynchus anatinus]|uniref:SWIM-type domain-containing protein n=1 Tax=Ornithorhynchus anatinus TaxID=9258 RepID=A0A6I8NH69_ORNAN|nr:uncharacterized protein ZSWIM9 [Ornithorhynchus anatinus]
MEERELQEREFFSWEEFSGFFDAWCEQRKVLFFVKNSVPLSKCKWAAAPPLPAVVDALKYSSVRLVCKDVRGPAKAAGRAPQKGCTASIVLKMSPRRDRLIVTECQLAHNHALCPIEFAYYFRKGYLLANSCLPVRTTNKISKQFVAPADVRRLLSYCKSRAHGVLDALRVLEWLFAGDPGAKVKLVFVEDQVIVKTVFFLTSAMMALLRRYPLMLFFDRMLGLNEELDLYTVLCVDGTGRGREVACCLTQKATPDLLRFTLASLVQSVPEVKPRVRCVTVGVEVGPQLDAVRELLPNARVQICRAQVLETLFSKAQELGAGEDGRLWPLLCRLAGAPSPAAYGRARRELGACCPAAFVSYFERRWQPRCEMWARFWAFETARNVNACELVGQHRRRLLAGLSPSPTVAQCILDLVALQREEEDDEEEEEEEEDDDEDEDADQREEPGRDDGGQTERVGWETGVTGWGTAPPLEVEVELSPGRDTEDPGWESGAARGRPRESGPEAGTPPGSGDPRASGRGAPASPEDSSRGAGGAKGHGGTGSAPGRETDPAGWETKMSRWETGREPAASRWGWEAPGASGREAGGSGGAEGEGPEVAWFRAACGAEGAGLVAEELGFARQHGARGFRAAAGGGYALWDGASEFRLDGALTRCSCSIHATRHLPCRHLFAARILTGAALVDVALLRDSWAGADGP